MDEARSNGPAQGAEDAVRTLLAYAGDDPNREGLIDTPARVVRAYGEWFGGYSIDAEAFMERSFEEGACDEMVVVRNVHFVSHCEHHMVPILGTATVGYVPNGRVVGLSKLARVVDAFARRLQVQERLTTQIADTVDTALKPKGVAVVIKAEHLCMSTRGVRQHASDTVTSELRGLFKHDAQARAEFMALAHA